MKKKFLSFAIAGAIALTALFGVNVITTGSTAPEADASSCGTTHIYDFCTGWNFFSGTGYTALEFNVNAECANGGSPVLWAFINGQWTPGVPYSWVLEPSVGYFAYCYN